jgi:hypothetical protein
LEYVLLAAASHRFAASLTPPDASKKAGLAVLGKVRSDPMYIDAKSAIRIDKLLICANRRIAVSENYDGLTGGFSVFQHVPNGKSDLFGAVSMIWPFFFNTEAAAPRNPFGSATCSIISIIIITSKLLGCSSANTSRSLCK